MAPPANSPGRARRASVRQAAAGRTGTDRRQFSAETYRVCIEGSARGGRLAPVGPPSRALRPHLAWRCECAERNAVGLISGPDRNILASFWGSLADLEALTEAHACVSRLCRWDWMTRESTVSNPSGRSGAR